MYSKIFTRIINLGIYIYALYLIFIGINYISEDVKIRGFIWGLVLIFICGIWFITTELSNIRDEIMRKN
jgi:hypothetical protein